MFAGLPEQARSLVLSVLPDAPTELRADLLAGRLAMIQALQGGVVTPAVAGLRAQAARLNEGESEARYALAALALLAAVSDGTAADAQALALRAVWRERRVAELAAGGLPNAEIAQTLFVTTRTVETHLTAAYRKLGITSRTALSSVL